MDGIDEAGLAIGTGAGRLSMATGAGVAGGGVFVVVEGSATC